MKRVLVALFMSLASVVALTGATTMPSLEATSKPSHSEPERTLVLRVRTAGSIKQAIFSGKLEFDTGAGPTFLGKQSTPFGIKIKANSLRGFFKKEAGAPDLFVELIDFSDEKEVGSITKTGATFDIDAHQSAGKSVLSIR